MPRILLLGGMLAAGVWSAGCGVESAREAADQSVKTETAGYPRVTTADAKTDGEEKDGRSQPTSQPDAKPVERKIIYTAHLEIVVEDLDKARKQLTELIKKHNGYVASSDITGRTGAQRRGMWTVRIPVDEFDDFRTALLDFGYPQRNSLSSEDITRQYFNLENRIRNAEATEKRLLKHLESSTEIKDTLAIEKELDRVRGRIEEMKGQLQMWQSLTALTTVHATLIERKGYTPPQEPDFGTRISRTFHTSMESLSNFGRGFVLFLVALAPWLPVIAILVVPLWWTIRRRFTRRGKTSRSGKT